jgi:hypothetical protein
MGRRLALYKGAICSIRDWSTRQGHCYRLPFKREADGGALAYGRSYFDADVLGGDG